MGQTSAERQRAYRERHADGAERINALVSPHAKRTLQRLARHRRQTQRQVLESLLAEAEANTVDALASTADYYRDIGASRSEA